MSDTSGKTSAMEKISNVLLPVASKMSSNKYLSAIRNGFMSIMPLIIVASLFTLINSVFLGEGHDLDQWFHTPFTDALALGTVINQAIMSVIAILLAFTVAKSLAEEYDMVPSSTSIVGAMAVACFLCLTPFTTDEKTGEYITTSYLSAAGMFTAFITAILAVKVYQFLSSFKALIIKMPDSVPEGVARSFNSLIPVALTIIIFGLVRMITNAAGAPMNDLITQFIQIPVTALVTSPIGLAIVYLLYMLLWGFGVHSAFIVAPILEPIYLANLTANAAVIQGGSGTLSIITKPFIDTMAFQGGAANMLALIIAIFLVSRRQDYKTIARIGFVPSLFNISEPLMFGLPVVMNPILIIPMIISTLVSIGIGVVATLIGFMPYTYMLIPWTTTPVLGAFLATGGSLTAALTALICLVVSVVIYAPFVVVMNKEEAIEAEEE